MLVIMHVLYVSSDFQNLQQITMPSERSRRRRRSRTRSLEIPYSPLELYVESLEKKVPRTMRLPYRDRYRLARDLWFTMTTEQQRPYRDSHRRLRDRLRRTCSPARRVRQSTPPPAAEVTMQPLSGSRPGSVSHSGAGAESSSGHGTAVQAGLLEFVLRQMGRTFALDLHSDTSRGDGSFATHAGGSAGREGSNETLENRILLRRAMWDFGAAEPVHGMQIPFQ